MGNFQIGCDTSTWIGARIVYLGDYEPELKKVFQTHIEADYTILDVGANIGFHTLFFRDLVGKKGKVIAFEPIPLNFESLNRNIALNGFKNIEVHQIALSNKNETISIVADVNSTNPGSFNLFDQNGDITVTCRIGDEIIITEKVDFIKIDVEGYESFVIDGLMKTITKFKPKIIFEYDNNYHKKTGLPANYIFSKIEPLGYHFFMVELSGVKKITTFENLRSGNIVAIPYD
ncbi:FkbM family methyltransferase [Pedobacter sp. Hv1]|uniref:FkbM family methyltransferase n=1 Tax=Pedobacter sp. Hv1 TaxID=1740090 RepID=UPI00137913E7|nr:FkbM family methyltransferase [Pedobacter sp. Hv1]